MNGWSKKGKFIYEHKITAWWIGIRKRQVTQLDDFKRLNGKWIKDSNLWNFQVKDSNGDIEFSKSANTQKEIFKLASDYMRFYPSKIYQHNFENKKIKVLVYNEWMKFNTVDEAKKHFLKAMSASEGSEYERYKRIYRQLNQGKTTVTDGVN